MKAARKYTKQDVLDMAQRCSNWGRWGPNDELGVLNFITPEDIASAAKLVQRGKVFALGLALDEKGPQRGLFGGRWNPLHQMLATGTNAVAGVQDETVGLRYADDAIHLPTQCATQWDALAHVFLGDKMWNGYPATLVDSRGAKKCGIQNFIDKMVGRGVLLDVARYKGVSALEDGYPITIADLEETAARQKVQVRRGDFVIIRTGQMEDCLQKNDWGGYAGGDAPGSRVRNMRMDPQEGDRRHLFGYVGHRSAAQRVAGGRESAVPLGHHSRDRHRSRRDHVPEGPRGRLRG